MYTDDPIADFEAYDFQQQKELEQLPRCSFCDKPITDEYCYMINGEPVHECCMNSEFRVLVDDLI